MPRQNPGHPIKYCNTTRTSHWCSLSSHDATFRLACSLMAVTRPWIGKEEVEIPSMSPANPTTEWAQIGRTSAPPSPGSKIRLPGGLDDPSARISLILLAVDSMHVPSQLSSLSCAFYIASSWPSKTSSWPV